MQPTLRLVASLALLQATLVSCSVASPPQGTLLTSSSSAGSAQQSPASSNHVKYIHVPYKAASSAVSGSLSAKLLDRLSQLLTLALPTLDDAHASAWGDEFESIPDSGLFGSGDPTFAWGGSTLEVVKTQATYVTRAAAFGPHIEAEEGQHGQLLPISDFYVVPAALRELWPRETACPYKGGPGWRDDDQGTAEPDEASPELRATQLARAQEYAVQAGDAEELLPPRDWVALVERGGGCSFAAKVRVAQALGAKAVVVGDAPSPGWHSPPGTDDDSDPGLAGRLLTMYAPGDTSDIDIPSTFVTRPSYLDLRRLIEELARDVAQRKAECKEVGNCPAEQDEEDGKHRAKGLEIVLARDDIMWEWPLIDLALMLLLLPSFMTIFTVIIHRIRVARQRRKDRAPEIAVLSLPCLIWRANGQPWEKIEGSDALPVSSQGETADPAPTSGSSASASAGPSGTTGVRDEEAGPSSLGGSVTTRPVAPPAATRSHAFLPPGRSYYSCDECAICLSDFVDGDKVRVLPCGHIFHRSEIDDWLVRIRKVCPICKRDVTVPIPPAPPGPVLNTPALSERHSESSAQSEDAELVDVAVAAPELETEEEHEQESEELAQPAPPASESTPLLPVNRQA